MAVIPQVNDATKFIQWRDITNLLNTNLGNIDTLDTTDKTSVVNSINEVVTTVVSNDGDITILIGEVDTLEIELGDITTLDTTDKTSTVNAINEVNATVGTNTTDISTNATNLGDITTLDTTDKTSSVNAINEINKNTNDIDLYNPNMDNGRFATETGLIATTFNSGTFFNTNNASTLTEGDSFIDNNTDNGGSAGSMGADMLSLLTLLETNGRTEKRYGYEFYIMDLTVGSGIVGGQLFNGTTYYPTTNNANMYLGAIGDTIMWAGYVRNTDATNDLLLGNSDTTLWVNGTLQGGVYELPSTNGWTYVKQTLTLTKEYYNLFPAISGVDTTVANVALSALYRNDVKTGHLGVVI